MDHFDTATMTYLATQMGQPNANTSDPFQDMLLPMEMQESQSNYAFAGSEELDLRALQPQAASSIKRFSSTNYEDPFSDVVSAFDNPLDQRDSEATSIERDNKLLSFSALSLTYTLLDYTYRRTTVSLSSQLHGMFFLAESPWAAAGDASAPPTELTCYRRNLFQITGEITLPKTLRYIMTEQGEQIPILGQELVVSATESTEGNPVKIISVPWKTPVNTSAQAADDKVEREPPSIPLDLMNTQEFESDFTSFPFQWKRLQFRIATANNGRRKELQQHFIVRLKLVAALATGGKIPICEVQSGAIIVRGRSPRNFQSRKDLPLNGAGNTRKASASVQPSQTARASLDELCTKAVETGVVSHHAKIESAVAPAMSTQSFFDPNDVQMPNDFYNWKANMGQTATMTALPPDRGSFGAAHAHAASSPDLNHRSRPPPAPTAPISLSLIEEDPPKRKEASTTPHAKRMQLQPRPPSFSLNVISSPDESADLLYEYFPLGLDDWMPPVDAVYRPHVVHHTNLPSNPRDPKGQQRGGRSKRYFAEDSAG